MLIKSKISPNDFFQVLKVVQEIFKDKLSPEAGEIYYQLLCEYTKEELQGAAIKILRTYKYPSMPKPAEFIEAALEIRKQNAVRATDVKQLYQQPTPEELAEVNRLVKELTDKLGGNDCKTKR